ncbi:hypothetical protein BH11GEM1_BH11GEM1_14450 [soil metagenome]
MRRVLLVAIALPILASSLHAQGVLGGRPGGVRINRRAGQLPHGADQPNRTQQLQQQIRRSLWLVTKQRLGFSDEQMLRLERTSQRYDQQRRALAQQEKAQRVTLRTEMVADTAANQAAIADALDQIHAVQVRRLEIQAEEQKELAAFMTPLQRATFTTLQEQVRRRLQEMARARADSATTAPPIAPL